jgi:very-long-chain enoyl-CoA reductase
MFIPSNWTLFSIIFHVFFGLFAIFLGFLDYYEVLPMRYSKFGTKTGIPSRLGMFTLYFLPIIVVIVSALPYLATATPIQGIVFGALILHFSKRSLEVLFVHKYSGHIAPLTFGVITFAYALMAGMISWLNARALVKMDVLFYMGIICLLVGEGGNLYHHKLLADLRTEGEGYFIPKGGWFEYATCPHYFFELLAWLGIFLLSRHLFTVLVFIAMLGYLTARSIKTRQWYRERFADYPTKRKNMIPFIF